MSTNHVMPKGFIFTISKVADEEKENTPIAVTPIQLGEHIASLIKNQIPAASQLNVKLSLESWDETYDNEEFMLQLCESPTNAEASERNYWIEL